MVRIFKDFFLVFLNVKSFTRCCKARMEGGKSFFFFWFGKYVVDLSAKRKGGESSSMLNNLCKWVAAIREWHSRGPRSKAGGKEEEEGKKHIWCVAGGVKNAANFALRWGERGLCCPTRLSVCH